VATPPPLPPPPLRLPPLTPAIWTAGVWRIQNGTDVTARTYPLPRYRFDAPHGEYPVLYACASPLGTLAEVYSDRGRRVGEDEGGRYLVRIVPRTPLPLLDLTDVRTLASLALDERISVGEDYATCQAWALALWQQLPQIAGVRYRARKAGADVANLALFLDRCLADLAVSVADTRILAEQETLVLEAADLYNLVVKIRFR